MNPCFDKTSTVRRLVPGAVNRLENIRYDIGGKGLNVALVLQQLCVQVNCIGCLGTADEVSFNTLLRTTGLDFRYLPLEGKTRTNLKLQDAETGVLTEFNEPGPPMDAEQFVLFISLLEKETANSSYVVFSGRVPEGCGDNAYQHCMRAIANQRCVLDATDNSLLFGIRERPFLIKPNLQELQAIIGQELRTMDEIRNAIHGLIKDGVQNVIVSMGEEGALFTDGKHTLYSPALQVDVKSTVGAGDAMLGGVLMGLEKGADMGDSFRFGVAAGAASVMMEGTQPLQYSDFEALLPKVTLRKI